MTKWVLAAGAAALAISSPTLAQKDRGGEKGKGGQQAAKVERGGGGGARPAKADRGGSARAVKAERGGSGRAAKVDRGGDGVRAAKADRGGSSRAVKIDRRGGDRTVRAERRGGNREARPVQGFVSRGDDKRQARGVQLKQADRGNVRVPDDNRSRLAVTQRGGDDRRARAIRIDDDRRGRVVRIDGDRSVRAVRINDDRRLRGVRFDDDRRVVRVDNDRFLRIDNDRVLRIDDDRFDRRFAGLGLIDNCPPGLAKKLNGCLPPGQARKGFDNNVFGLGAVLPATFAGTRFVPDYYRDYDRSFYSDFLLDDDDYYYRYDDGYMYRVDRDYNIVAGLIPLLGGGYSMGQPYPLGYSAYNVPYQYRSYYADDDDYYYRYGDGGIYQVDRSTGLIAAIVSLLAGGLSVGQPLPLGYDAYNVPYAYRARYYDTPDNWYRYNDGNVYGIDPRTRIVQTVIVV